MNDIFLTELRRSAV